MVRLIPSMSGVSPTSASSPLTAPYLLARITLHSRWALQGRGHVKRTDRHRGNHDIRVCRARNAPAVCVNPAFQLRQFLTRIDTAIHLESLSTMTEDEKAQRRLERLKFRLAHALELIRATTAFEHAVLRPPLILNGGALVVSLTLFGALQKQSSTINGRSFKFALMFWIAGVLLASVATAFGYYSQAAFRKFRDRELDETWAEDEGDTVKGG